MGMYIDLLSLMSPVTWPTKIMHMQIDSQINTEYDRWNVRVITNSDDNSSPLDICICSDQVSHVFLPAYSPVYMRVWRWKGQNKYYVMYDAMMPNFTCFVVNYVRNYVSIWIGFITGKVMI